MEGLRSSVIVSGLSSIMVLATSAWKGLRHDQPDLDRHGTGCRADYA